jgi:hypothetical protein
MPAVILDKPKITSLKQTYKLLSTTDFAYLALQFDKDPANSTQNIDADTFYTNWGLTNTELFAQLRSLESKKLIKVNPAIMTVTWAANPATTMTQAEVQNMYKDGLINSTAYVYYALVLAKGASLTQQVDPAVYSVAPWTIDSTTLMSELNSLAMKKDDVTKMPILTLDLGAVSIVWLV